MVPSSSAESEVSSNRGSPTSRSSSKSLRRPAPLPSVFPFLTSDDPPLVHHRFPYARPAPIPSVLSTFAGALFTTRSCFAPITALFTRLLYSTPTPQPNASASKSLPSSAVNGGGGAKGNAGVVEEDALVFPDQWSGCPSSLLAWSFSYLLLEDLLRCRQVSHAWHALLTSHPLSPLCHASASLALPTPSRWTTRSLRALFNSVPFLTALSFSRLDDDLATATPTPLTPAPSANALQPVPLPAVPLDPQTAHLHTVFQLHSLRVLLLPFFPLTNADLFQISAHLPTLEVLSLQLPSHSDTLSAVGFAHLSVMRRLAHLIVQYEDVHLDAVVSGDDGEEGGVREAMIVKQECWLAMMRCKSLRALTLVRNGRALEEVDVWQARRKERDERKLKQQTTSPTPVAGEEKAPGEPSPPASPSHSRRASVPIPSSLHALDCRAQTLLSLPSSSSFSFSLFFSAFSANLRSFTFSSLAAHVNDVPLYTDIEMAVLAALPSFSSLQEVQLNLMSLTLSSLQPLTALAPRLLSFALSRSLLMRESEPLSPHATTCLQHCMSSWGTISADSFNAFLRSFPLLASLRLQNLPFVTSESFPALVAAVPNLHSLHVSLISLDHVALSALFSLRSLVYLEVTVDEPVEQRTADEVAVWLEMSVRYREWEKRWRLGRMGVHEEEEEEIREKRRAEAVQEARRRRWIRLKQIEEGQWDDTLEEEFMNDDDEEDDDGDRHEAERTYESDVLAVWQQLFYLDRLRDGDHHRQAVAKARWRERRQSQMAMAAQRMAMVEDELLEVTDLEEGEEDDELDEVQVMDEVRSSARTMSSKPSPVLASALHSLVASAREERRLREDGEEQDWDNVPL